MGRPGFGTSFFGGLSARLSRVLGLSGAVDPEVDINAKAVILGLDCSQHGFNDGFSGRQWFLRANQTGGVAPPTIGIRAQVDLLIEGILVTLRNPTAADAVTLRIYGPQDAMATEPTAAPNNGVFFERCLSVSEKPPLLLIGANAVAGSGGTLVVSSTVTSAIDTRDQNFSSYFDFLRPMVLGAGNGLVFSAANVNSVLTLGLGGRVLAGAQITQ